MQVNKLKILIIIFLVAVMGVFGIAYFGQQTSPAENNEKVSQEIDTSDGTPSKDLSTEGWKTYRDEEFGFEFQYPRNWIFYNIKEVNADGTFEYLYDKKVNNKIIFLDKKFINKGLGPPALTVSIVDLNGNFQNYINSIFKECNNIKNTKIDEVEFIKLECEGYADPNYYIGIKDKKIYTFSSIGGMNFYLDIIIDSLVIK